MSGNPPCPKCGSDSIRWGKRPRIDNPPVQRYRCKGEEHHVFEKTRG